MNITINELLTIILADNLRECLRILKIDPERIKNDLIDSLPLSAYGKKLFESPDTTQDPVWILIKQAESIAMGLSGADAGEFQPLQSIFSSLRLPGKPQAAPVYCRIGPLGGTELMFTSADAIKDDLAALTRQGEALLAEWNAARKCLGDDSVLHTFMSGLLLRYGWCLPSPGVSGVSLAERARVTAAVSYCLLRFNEEHRNADHQSQPFCLLGVDFTGIQRYLFAAARGKGTAKRLRARSFFVSMALEAFALRLLKEGGLPITNLLIASGGKFFILMPNTNQVRTSARRAIAEESAWLFKTYGGTIALSVGLAELTAPELSDFGNALDAIDRIMRDDKLQPHHLPLQTDGGWDEAAFLGKNGAGDTICVGCNRELVSSGEYCQLCAADEHLGRNLANASFLYYYSTSAPGRIQVGPELWARISATAPGETETGLEWILALNNTDLSTAAGFQVYTRFLANTVPVFGEEIDCRNCCIKDSCKDKDQAANGQPAYFDCLAARATGKPYLGYLKMDVDNMGILLSMGFAADVGTVAPVKITAFCRMLDYFFGTRIDALIQADYPDCYVIFSGGDDLLVAGPWDRIYALADEIAREFRTFTATNESITISGGISLAKPRRPVFLALAEAEENLEKAKYHIHGSDAPARKNCCFALGQALNWSDFDKALQEAKKLALWVDQKITNSSFVQRLLRYWEIYSTYLKDGRISGLKYLPLLAYDLTRNKSLPGPEKRDESLGNLKEQTAFRLWAQSLLYPKSPIMLAMGVIAGYANLATRTKEVKQNESASEL